MKKMKRIHYKRISGLFILLAIFLIGNPINIYAKGKTTKEKCAEIKAEISGADYFANRYGIAIDEKDSDSDNIVVKMKSDAFPSGLKAKNVKFKVVRIASFKGFDDKGNINYDGSKSVTDANTISNEYIISGNKILTPGKKIKIKRGNLSSQNGFEVYLEPDGWKDPIDTIPDCNIKWGINVYAEIESSGGGVTKGTVTVDYGSDTTELIPHTDCTGWENFPDKKSLNYKFCHAKAEAYKRNTNKNKRVFDFGELEQMTSEVVSGAYEKKYDPSKFTCDKKTIINGQSLISQRLNGDFYAQYKDSYYDSNTDYMYGYAKVKKEASEYIYHLEGLDKPKTESVKCSLKCEEAVIVEYGPPVASEAGLCFGYKVKLTSIVSCEQIKAPKKPEHPGWCNPRPLCIHPGGGTYLQGGPNEEFDSCIKNCDGGKYTEKCVSKCYNKVYGKGNKKVSNELQLKYEVQKVNDNDSNSKKSGKWIMPAPKYDYQQGQVVWDNAKTTDKYARPITSSNWNGSNYIIDTDPLWHRTHSWGVGTLSFYTAYHNPTGIPKKANCKDSCYWQGCNPKVEYLNQEQAEADAEYNKQVYNELKDICNAAASCTTTTAEFTIKVNKEGNPVVDKDGKEQEGNIEFPYSTADKKDKLTSQGKPDNHEVKLPDDTTIIGYNGCYKDYKEKRWYQTEWTFPGTWIESKSKKMQFIPTKDNGYRVYEGLFCLPRNAKTVNKDWWWYYYANVTSGAITTSPWNLDKNCSDDPTDDKPPCKYSVNDQNYMNNIDKCKSSNGSGTATCDLSSKKDASKLPEPTMNIRAESNKFGYFGWNIVVECFYAMVKDKTCPNPTDTSTAASSAKVCKDPVNTETGYRIRTVDLGNLFPSEEGTKLTNPDSTGRSPGFNWSEYATQTTKDKGFISNPKAYTKYVQENGRKIYSDENMDYRIKLTKDMITEVKRKVRSGEIDYGKPINDNGSIIENSSVIHYKSAYIRESGRGIVYPGDTALKCNNIGEREKNTKSEGYTASCQEFE